VVLPRAEKSGLPETDPRLAMVHMDLGDSNLGIGWVKTLGTAFYDEARQKLDSTAWGGAIRERQALGLSELPLVTGEDWETESTRPVSAEQLNRLKTKMAQYFEAAPSVRCWELGIEENLGYRGNPAASPYYWPNLDAKARVVREAANSAGVKVRLIYQIAELDPASVEAFCSSAAGRQFDILSLHPYAWPDFPAPEKWIPLYLSRVHASMRKRDVEKPIWFTEIGAPINGNPGGFFGYPANGVCDRGLTREEHAEYLVKCHLIAFESGVEKIFWYNYRDRGNSPEYAEDHFGMVDYQGFPKPAYAAYCNLARSLHGKRLTSRKSHPAGLQEYRFAGPGGECIVAWSYPAAKRTVSAKSLGIAPGSTVQLVDLMGKPIPIHNHEITLTDSPVYAIVQPKP